MEIGLRALALQNEVLNALLYATSKGFQIHPDAFAMLKGLDGDIVLRTVQEIIETKKQASKNSVILADDIRSLTDSRRAQGNGGAAAAVLAEQSCKVLMDPTPKVSTAEGVDGYVTLFRSRFEKTMRILSQRPDSKRISKISSMKQNLIRKNNNSNVVDKNERSLYGSSSASSSSIVAGLLMSKRSRKNGIEFVVDDYTGTLSAIAVSEEARKQASTLALDQMVMLELENRNSKGVPAGTMTVKSVMSPDIPDHLPNRSKSEVYAVLISDIHVGSKHFMEAEFLRFLDWLSSSDDDDNNKDIVRKIRFLCIGGDLIDGIGIFPNQDKELIEMDATKQLSHLIKLLSKVPSHIKVLIIPGNHDPGRRALPQPAIPMKNLLGHDANGELGSNNNALENCLMLGNPALVELNGVKVLMYHGQSLDDIIATTPGLNYSRPAEAMKVLLKARHLSPTYGGRTPVAPELEDMLVISEVPDILHSGHVHVVDVQNYRGTLIVNSGAWQRQTKYQQTMGIVPTPGIAVIVNLATLQPFINDFNYYHQ